MLRLRRVSLALALSLLAAGCGHSKPPSTHRIVSSASPGAATPTSKPTPTATAAATPRATPSRGVVTAPKTPAPNLARATVKLTKLASFDQPVAMAQRAGDATFYVVQKSGTVIAWRNGNVLRTVLDISGEISKGSEQGLLGLAFSKDGNKLYVYFTSATSTKGGAAGDDVLREYAYVNGKATGGREIFRFADPYANHNGGNVVLGPDGYLYVGLGDGGSAGDPGNNAQNLDSPLGKMLRLNPTPSGGNQYTVPSSNPFASSSGTKALVWAYGLRNPWRWSFDAATKDLWIGDVGQDMWEEIDVQPASGHGGDNYGWNRMEGNHSYNGGTPPGGYHRPVYEYSHDGGNCSVTGGYRYRGKKIRDLQGAYVFGDYCVGKLRAFTLQGTAATNARFLGVTVEGLSSFGQDSSGELYAFSLNGAFYRIDPA